jgi:hypothetical protein
MGLLCGGGVGSLVTGIWSASRRHRFCNRQKRCETEALEINVALNQSLIFSGLKSSY